MQLWIKPDSGTNPDGILQAFWKSHGHFRVKRHPNGFWIDSILTFVKHVKILKLFGFNTVQSRAAAFSETKLKKGLFFLSLASTSGQPHKELLKLNQRALDFPWEWERTQMPLETIFGYVFASTRI